MKKLMIVAGGLGCVLLLATCAKRVKKAAPPVSTGNNEIRAVSLNGLEQKLKACMPRDSCPQELLQLAGIKKIMGVIADEQNHDLVLFGQTDPSLPPLNLEDFVVALRNAWFKYAPLSGNTYEYSHPGCSIDPNPKVVQELQRIGQSFHKASASGNATKSIDEWNRVCEGSQSVRVLGIPFDTHFAQVLVKADYDMKRLVDGSDAIDIPGLTSMTDMEVEKAQSEIDQHQPISLSAPSLNRFWFYPGKNIYEERDGIVIIKQSPVKLLTEQMYSKLGEELAGSGGVDPSANEYADGLTVLYDKLAQERPVYAELASLFRFTALAKIIKSKYAATMTGLDLSYLLEAYPVASTSVAKSLPGRHAVKEIQHREDTATGYSQVHLWFPSCGGVDIRIDAEFRRSPDERLSGFKQAVLGSRLAKDTTYWVFNKDPKSFASELFYNSRITDLNNANKESRLFTISHSIEGKTFKYRLYDGESTEEFSDVPALVQRVNDKSSLDPRKVIYFDALGFPTDDKIEAFAWTCRNQQTKLNKEVEIITLSRRGGSTELQDAFLSRGIRFDEKASKIEEVREGKFRGKFRAALMFSTYVGRTLKVVVVSVYFKTMAQAQTFLNAVRSQSSTPRFRLSSMSDVIIQIRGNIKEEDIPELGDINIAKMIATPELEAG